MIESRRTRLARRLLALHEGRDDVLRYTQLTMPDISDPDDVTRSRYMVGRHHRAIADVLHDLASGRTQRAIINCGPRHGKSELASKRFIAWFAGKFPERSIIFGTYNDTFAGDNGRAVRDILMSPAHRQIFPGFELKDHSMSAQRLETTRGGIITFVGRGTSTTGRGGHAIVIDDPIKDRVEADSKIIREQLWTWFTQVIATRLMTQDSFILLIQTRWHEDDLVGRLTDPTNPFYDPEIAKEWTVIDLPALALENDPLGRQPGEALWPEKFPVAFLLRQQRLDPRGFQALYQGRPSPERGAFFHRDHLKTYRQDELPKNLRIYAASDHAVSITQGRDKNCLMIVGVDEKDNIWVLPDTWWRQGTSDQVVEQMLKLLRQHKPIYWWAERGQISKSIGPFLRKRMMEDRVFGNIIEVQPTADKQTRAQSIAGRMAMGCVYFPSFAPWWPEAHDQLLKFPHGAHDDFVDALAYIGLGLALQVPAGLIARARSAPREGTLGWIKDQTKQAERAERIARNVAGF